MISASTAAPCTPSTSAAKPSAAPLPQTKIPLKDYLRAIDFLDSQNNLDPKQIPKVPPTLQEGQIKTMDTLFEDPVPIISTNGFYFCDLSLKNIVDMVESILKANPELGKLIDVVVVGGKINQILNLDKHGETHLKELNVPGYNPAIHCHSQNRYSRVIPDMDVRFVLEGCNGQKRMILASKMEDEFVKLVRKKNPQAFYNNSDPEVKREIINTFFTKFSNPDEIITPDDPQHGNSFLVMGMGNRVNYGLELIFADRLIRQEVFSQELKISYLNKNFYMFKPEEVAWVWQGLTDKLTGQLHIRDLKSLGPVVWQKLISYYLLGSELPSCVEERPLANKGEKSNEYDLRKYILEHYALNLSERLAYLIRYALTMTKHVAADYYPTIVGVFLKICPHPFLVGDITQLHTYGVHLNEVEALAYEWIEHPDPNVFLCGYELLLQIAKVNPLSSLKLRLKHLPKYVALVGVEAGKTALEPMCAHAGNSADNLRALFATDKSFTEFGWVSVLLNTPSWEKEGFEIWREIIPTEKRTECTREVFRNNPATGLKLLTTLKGYAPALANDIALKYSDPGSTLDEQGSRLLANSSEWFFMSLIEGGNASRAFSFYQKYPHLPLSIQVFRSLYAQLPVYERGVLRTLLRTHGSTLERKTDWMFAAGPQIRGWIDTLIVKEEWEEAFKLIHDLHHDGIIKELNEDLFKPLRAWIDTVLAIRANPRHLWYIGLIDKLINEHPDLYDPSTRTLYCIMLLNKAVEGLTRTALIGYVGRINWLLQGVVNCLGEMSEGKIPDHFHAAVVSIEHVLSGVIYDHYPLYQTTAAHLTRLLPNIMAVLHSQRKYSLILELTEAFQKRKAEKITVQATPETIEAWLYACNVKLKKAPLTIGERQYLQKIISRLPQLKALYPEGKEKKLYAALEETLEALYYFKEEELALSLYTALAEVNPANVERYRGIAVSALECFSITAPIKEVYARFKSAPVELSQDQARKGMIAQRIVERSLNTEPREILVNDLLSLMKAYKIKSLQLWEELFKAFQALKNKSKMEACWDAFREIADDQTDSPKLHASCWNIGIAALADVSSERLEDFITNLEGFRASFASAETKPFWVDTYLNLLRGTLPRLPKELNNDITLCTLWDTLRTVEVHCKHSPSRIAMFDRSKYALLTLKGALPNFKDFQECVLLLIHDLKGPATVDRRMRQGEVVHALVREVNRFNTDSENKAYEQAMILIEEVMETPDTYYDPFFIIAQMIKFKDPVMLLRAAMFLENSIRSTTRKFKIREYFSANELSSFLNRILSNPDIKRYLGNVAAFNSLAMLLQNALIRDFLKPDDLAKIWELIAMNVLPLWLEHEQPNELYTKVSKLLIQLGEDCRGIFKRNDFHQLVMNVLRKYLKCSRLKLFTSMSFNYFYNYIIALGCENFLDSQDKAVDPYTPHQSCCGVKEPVKASRVLVKSNAKMNVQLTPYLMKVIEVVNMAFETYQEPSTSLATKAYICDLGKLYLCDLVSYAKFKDERFQAESEKLIRDYFYLVSPDAGNLFFAHTHRMEGSVSSDGIVLCGVSYKYFEKRRGLLAELIFFLLSEPDVLQAIIEKFNITFTQDELVKGITRGVKTLLERHLCMETNIYVFKMVKAALENAEFQNYSFLPELIKISELTLSSEYLHTAEGRNLLQQMLRLPLLSKVCPNKAQIRQKAPVLMQTAKAVIGMILALYKKTKPPGMREFFYYAFDFLDNLTGNYMEEYSKDYCAILDDVRVVVVDHLKKKQGPDEECTARFVKLVEASNLSVPEHLKPAKAALYL